MTVMDPYATMPNSVIDDFNKLIKLTENHYKKDLLSIKDGQLIKVGPMNKNEALFFFNQFYRNTIPLYMFEVDNEYYAYY